jgi:hypothetical protein
MSVGCMPERTSKQRGNHEHGGGGLNRLLRFATNLRDNNGRHAAAF